MRFLEHLLQEGITKKIPDVPGLNRREVEVFIQLIAKHMYVEILNDWQHSDYRTPQDFIGDGKGLEFWEVPNEIQSEAYKIAAKHIAKYDGGDVFGPEDFK